MNPSQRRVEDVLIDFFNEAEQDVHSKNFVNGSLITKAHTKATNELHTLVLNMIGQDEPLSDESLAIDIPTRTAAINENNRRQIRNEHRAELRQRANELFGIKDEGGK